MEATAATVLAAAIIGSATGVTWLVVQLPSRLQQIESSIERLLGGQERLGERFEALDTKVREHEVRIIKLEQRP